MCFPGHDPAVQSAELHLHARGLLSSPLLPAPQPLLRPAGQGHQAALRRQCGLLEGEQQLEQRGSAGQETERGERTAASYVSRRRHLSWATFSASEDCQAAVAVQTELQVWAVLRLTEDSTKRPSSFS